MPFPAVYAPPRRGLSFELFPPKRSEDLLALEGTVRELMRFDPDYFTCTYGAGGSSQDRTLEVISRVKQITDRPVASHLTCVAASTEQLCSYLERASQHGVDLIVALRGDPPRGEAEFRPVEGGLRYANELVSLIRDRYPHFGVAVAGYPETHQEAPSPEVDLDNLKRKVDAGADVVITQLFYDNEDFFRFRERAQKRGITIPIIPGLLPITNLPQAQRITSMCKAALPQSLVSRLEEDDSPDWQFQVGVQHAREQTRELLREGVEGLHLYVLNRSQAAAALLEGLELAYA